MSRWWGSELRIVLGPTCLVAVRVAHRIRPKVVSKASFPLMSTDDGPPWRAAVHALGDFLKEAPTAGLPLSVLLSGRFTRFAIVPWNEKVLSREERIAFARHRFKEKYGALSSNWAIELATPEYGQSAVACAIDEALLDAVKEAAVQAKAEIAVVRPCFISAYNQFRRNLGSERGVACLATVEPDLVTLGMFANGQWRAIRSRRTGADWSQALRAVLMEEIAAGTLDSVPSSIHVFAPDTHGMNPIVPKTKLLPLQFPACRGFSPPTDARFAAALCGVV